MQTDREYFEKIRKCTVRFYTLDDENKSVEACFVYDSVYDLFDCSIGTKTPILSDDFVDNFKYTFESVPDDYTVDFIIKCKDSESFTESQLEEIFRSNIELQALRTFSMTKRKVRLSYALIFTGLILLVATLFIEKFWVNGGFSKKVFSYVIDIATTVTIWEAMNILLVDMKEQRRYLKNIRKRFHSIRFKCE
ncbi:MAG: hypothetical protein K6F82_06885 [Sphaerochaetaceae bacterium]|nr:hypothetical protein [Sphaerochaetaceae bacterium]